MKYKLTIIAIILICFQSFAQITKLDSLRTKNISNSNKKKYNAEIIHKKELQENPPLIPTIEEYKKNKTVRLFNIKKEDRKHAQATCAFRFHILKHSRSSPWNKNRLGSRES